MFLSNAILSFSLLCSLAFAIPQSAPPIVPIHNDGFDGVITALLRAPTLHRGALIRGRQTDNTCSPGHHQCSDGIGCCPTGQTCGVFSGKGGCCPEGKTCVTNSSPCEFAGYVLCFGESFCCPAGDICSRDSAGAQKCTKPDASSKSVAIVPSTLSTPMIAQSQVSSTSHTPTSSTPAPAPVGSSTNRGSRSISNKSSLTFILPLLAGLALSAAS